MARHLWQAHPANQINRIELITYDCVKSLPAQPAFAALRQAKRASTRNKNLTP